MKQISNYKFVYRSEIDTLRGIAILSILIFHFFPKLLPEGYLGVDIFFVISGYLITKYFISNSQYSFKERLRIFYQRRIKRIFPAFFLSLVITYVFVSLIFLEVDISSFENSLLASFTFWANLYFWRDGGYFGGIDQLKPLLHIWSLSVEKQFYILFPFILYLLINFEKKKKFFIFSFLFLLIILSFVLWLWLNYIGGKNPAFFLFPTRVWQFGLGSLLSIALLNKNTLMKNKYINLFFFTISIFLILISFTQIANSQIRTILISIGTTGFMAFLDTHKNSLAIIIIKSEILLFFGKISYSLYLYHWPIAVILNYYFVDGVPFIYSLISILLSILFGFISYKFIETSFRYKYPLSSTLKLIIICLLVSLFLYLININNNKNDLANNLAKVSGTNYRCDISSYKTYGSSRACILKTTEVSKNKIILLGNSHAQMYAPLISEATPANLNLILVPLNGCLPTTTINISSVCLNRAKENLSTVLKDKNVRIVILASTWFNYKYINQKGQEVESSQIISAYDSIISEIERSDKYAILISPIATPKKNYVNILSRKLKFNNIYENEVYESMKISRNIFEQEFSIINSHFQNSMKEKYLKIYNELCDENHCYFGNDKTFFFADSNHLSINSLVYFKKTRNQLRSILMQLNKTN